MELACQVHVAKLKGCVMANDVTRSSSKQTDHDKSLAS